MENLNNSKDRVKFEEEYHKKLKDIMKEYEELYNKSKKDTKLKRALRKIKLLAEKLKSLFGYNP